METILRERTKAKQINPSPFSLFTYENESLPQLCNELRKKILDKRGRRTRYYGREKSGVRRSFHIRPDDFLFPKRGGWTRARFNRISDGKTRDGTRSPLHKSVRMELTVLSVRPSVFETITDQILIELMGCGFFPFQTPRVQIIIVM